MHADRRRGFIVGGGLALVALMLAPVWPPLSVIASVGGLLASSSFIYSLNVGWTRAVYAALVAVHAASVWMATESIALTVAAAVFFVPSMGLGETVVGRLGYRALWMSVLAPVGGLVACAFAWPYDLRLLAVAPALVISIRLARGAYGAITRLRASARERWEVAVGDVAPDVRLRTSDGKREFRLTDERGRFVLLLFVRTDWCPVCHVQMRIYQKESATLDRLGVKVVAIGPGKGDDSAELHDLLGLEYLTLFDEDLRVAKRFGAIQTNAPNGKLAPLPASFLIDREGRVMYSTRADHIGEFAPPARLVEILREASGPGAPAAAA